VSQSKFTLLKIMPGNIFGAFMEFFPKGLNSFKIQTKFKCNLVPEFVIQILLGIWTSSQKESCSFWIYLSPFLVSKFLAYGKLLFYIFQCLNVESLWKRFEYFGRSLYSQPAHCTVTFLIYPPVIQFKFQT
jgi:hypothetical protein